MNADERRQNQELNRQAAETAKKSKKNNKNRTAPSISGTTLGSEYHFCLALPATEHPDYGVSRSIVLRPQAPEVWIT